jgi:ArsR family transcriptional regulator, arsenate/arsenite/antimonite-responsive transcriptional repressor
MAADLRVPAPGSVDGELMCCTPLLEAPLDEAAAVELAEMLKAVADPVRLRLVSIVAAADAGEVCACDLPGLVDRSQPTVSHHLSLLVKAGILDREQRGKWAWFRLRPERLTALAAVLAPPP